VTRDDDSESTRDRILGVAGQLFAERGYDAVSIADIAQAGGISTGLIYYHFKDKQALYETSVREGLHLLEDAGIRALTGDAPAVDKIRGFVAEYMSLVEQHAAIMRMLIRGVTDLTGPAPGSLILRSQAAIDRLEAVIADGIADGTIRQTEPRLAALCLFALVNTPITARSLEGSIAGASHLSADDQAAFVAELFLKGVEAC